MPKKILIIGGGVAGLAAGSYARMNGFDAEIYKMHDISGGLCTAWKREGYTFDGCIHWLVGSKPGTGYHRMWDKLGLVQGKTFISWEYYTQAVDERGAVFTAYTDPDRLEEHMSALVTEGGFFYRRA